MNNDLHRAAQEQPEPELPYSPSNTGRRARVGYLGFDGVGFNELWPLFAGVIASTALALRFFVAGGGPSLGWKGKTLLAALPFLAGFAYLRLLVVGRPPHFKADLLTRLLELRLDFADPPFRVFPILPRVVARSAASGPSRAADLRHPIRGRA